MKQNSCEGRTIVFKVAKLFGVHHGVGVQKREEKLDEGLSVGEGNPNMIRD